MKLKIKEKIIEILSYIVIAISIITIAPFVMIFILFWDIIVGLINKIGK